MIRHTKHIILLLIIFAASGCIDEYDPEFKSDFERLLVVEGNIHQGAGPFRVRLSYTVPVDQPNNIPGTGFEVIIIDDLGHEFNLIYTGDGYYEGEPSGFEAEVGRKYKLHLFSPETGKTYESSWETIGEPVQIETVYTQAESHEDPDFNHNLQGLQFYLNTGDFATDTTYFMWELIETYKYYSNYALAFIYDGEMKEAQTPDSLYVCYRTDAINNIFTRGTADLAQNSLSGYPLHFVDTETKRLMARYSILVRQHVISGKAHLFWKEVNELINNNATLFASQPYQIQGNIRNINNDSEVVLGYFSASGVSEKRIFIDRPSALDFYYPLTCELYTQNLESIFKSLKSKWPLFLTKDYSTGFPIPAYPPDQSCIDCRDNGGVVEPPEFWIE
ncbi:MAG: DUF4249 domain-containing protein [Bacteroidales bacterium]